MFAKRPKHRLDRHHRVLPSYANALAGDPELARDLTQECAVRALRVRTVPREEPAYEAWLFTILRNLWLDTGAIRTASAPGSIIVPDLTQTGLTARTIEPAVRLGAVTASHVTYLGRRGCRLSLYAYQAEGAGPALPPLAGAMRKATRDAAPPDAATRIAIGRARQPCRA